MDLSSSVSAPVTSSSMSLSSSLLISLTTRGKRWNTSPMATMRSDSEASRMHSTRAVTPSLASAMAEGSPWRRDRLAAAPAITSSPTRLISWSSLPTSTLMKTCSWLRLSSACFCLRSAAVTTGGATRRSSTSNEPSGGAGRAASCCSSSTRSSSKGVSAPLLTRISPRRAGVSGRLAISAL
ncbi:hypothetical protein D9M70_548130 [compost metagenome]